MKGDAFMFLKEVCQTCSLTKKAIEYYEEQGLISPEILSNGYRYFDESQVEKLKKISLLRKLDLRVSEIKEVLNIENSAETLNQIIYRRESEIKTEKMKNKLLEKLSQGISWEKVGEEVKQLIEKQTIQEKLLDTFPGYYGRFISIHFGRFLNDPITTEEQKDAYNNIVAFLDNVEKFNLPQDLIEYLEDSTKDINTKKMEELTTNMTGAIENIDDFMEKNKKVLECYLAYKQSDEYRNSPAFRLQEFYKKFNSESGYYDVFIPNMKRLSSQYNEYYTKLERANDSLLKSYPEIEKLDK